MSRKDKARKANVAHATKNEKVETLLNVEQVALQSTSAVVEKATEHKVAQVIIDIEQKRRVHFPDTEKGKRCKALARLLCELSKRNETTKLSLADIKSYLILKGINVKGNFDIASNVALREALDPMFTGLEGKSEKYLKTWANVPRLGEKSDKLSITMGIVELTSNNVDLGIDVQEAVNILNK
jgi:hypothetical protein